LINSEDYHFFSYILLCLVSWMNSYYVDKGSRIICIALMILISTHFRCFNDFKKWQFKMNCIWLYSLYKGKTVDALELSFQVIN